MKTKEIVSGHVNFLVRQVEPGEQYGLNNALTNEGTDSLVEFYDTRYKHTEFGQFVSRYNKETLLSSKDGLLLDTGSPDWVISKEAMSEVRQWLSAPMRHKIR